MRPTALSLLSPTALEFRTSKGLDKIFWNILWTFDPLTRVFVPLFDQTRHCNPLCLGWGGGNKKKRKDSGNGNFSKGGRERVL